MRNLSFHGGLVISIIKGKGLFYNMFFGNNGCVFYTFYVFAFNICSHSFWGLYLHHKFLYAFLQWMLLQTFTNARFQEDKIKLVRKSKIVRSMPLSRRLYWLLQYEQYMCFKNVLLTLTVSSITTIRIIHAFISIWLSFLSKWRTCAGNSIFAAQLVLLQNK